MYVLLVFNSAIRMQKAHFLDLIHFIKSYFNDSSNKEKIELFIEKAKNENAWFSDSLIRHAMKSIENQFFDCSIWEQFFSEQGDPSRDTKIVGLVLAGNLPAVGLHDVLMTLASGHEAWVKPSTQDKALIELYIQVIQEFDTRIPIQVVDRLQGIQAVIATGSDFSGGYFAHYFAQMPHIIRKNRSSLAILTGQETNTDFSQLARDIFTYYGLGCRNVSSLAVPLDYDLTPLFDVLTEETWVLDHSKYSNNFQYHRTLFLLNQIPHFDLGNVLVTENDAMVSPVGVLYIHRYANQVDLEAWLATHEEKIQCKVCQSNHLEGTIAFGMTQEPGLADFADGVNTYAFLTNLS